MELLRFTVTPPTGAIPVSVTVQVEVPGAFTLDGVQLSELGWIVGKGSAIEPPDGMGLRSIYAPSASENETAETPMGIVDEEGLAET